MPNLLPSWQTVRDLILAALVAGAAAAVDYLTASIQAHPLGSAVLTAVVVAVLGILRRALNPTVPVAELDHVRFEPTLKLTTRTPSVADIDLPTPIYGSPALAMSADDDQFLAECASQIHAYTPGGKIKQFDPATLIAILVYLFQHSDEIEALIERAKKFISGLLAAWRLRRAIKAAMLAEGNTAYPSLDSVDGVATWLYKADGGVIRRVRMIADGRRK